MGKMKGGGDRNGILAVIMICVPFISCGIYLLITRNKNIEFARDPKSIFGLVLLAIGVIFPFAMLS
jgi:hypothetical protein